MAHSFKLSALAQVCSLALLFAMPQISCAPNKANSNEQSTLISEKPIVEQSLAAEYEIAPGPISGEAMTVAFDGEQIWFGNRDGLFKIALPDEREPKPVVKRIHSNSMVCNVRQDSNGHVFFSELVGSQEATAFILEYDHVIAAFPSYDWLTGSFSIDGKHLVANDIDGGLFVYDFENRKLTDLGTMTGHVVRGSYGRLAFKVLPETQPANMALFDPIAQKPIRTVSVEDSAELNNAWIDRQHLLCEVNGKIVDRGVFPNVPNVDLRQRWDEVSPWALVNPKATGPQVVKSIFKNGPNVNIDITTWTQDCHLQGRHALIFGGTDAIKIFDLRSGMLAVTMRFHAGEYPWAMFIVNDEYAKVTGVKTHNLKSLLADLFQYWPTEKTPN